jgi:hypothetical protein
MEGRDFFRMSKDAISREQMAELLNQDLADALGIDTPKID